MLFVKVFPYSLISSAIASFALFGLAGCNTFREPPDSETYIFLDKEETLFVEFIFNPDLDLELRFPRMTEGVLDRRREQFYSVMRTLLQVHRFPMDVHLLEENEKPGEGPLLELYATRWEQDPYGEVVVALRAKLERYGDLNTLGFFKEQDFPVLGTSYERIEELYERLMSEALSRVFIELDSHFETLEEAAFVNEVPTS